MSEQIIPIAKVPTDYERQRITDEIMSVRDVIYKPVLDLLACTIPKYIVAEDGRIEQVWPPHAQRAIDEADEAIKLCMESILRRYGLK